MVTEEFVKGGCPSHLRGQLWKQILQCNVGEKVLRISISKFKSYSHAYINFFIDKFIKEKTYFQAKRQAVIQTDYLTDKIIIKVKLICLIGYLLITQIFRS